MSREWTETLYDAYGQSFQIDKVYFESKTAHQHLMIFHNATFGRVMVLDGIVQTCERDEFIYHEMLAHVPIISHGNAKRVLIIGGGDGGIVREVAKHQGVEYIAQVEIDQAVIDMAKQFLPKHSDHAFEDPRLEIFIDDGCHFVAQSEAQFDVIISDCTDPIGPGKALFSSDFYHHVSRLLAQDGVFVAQNGVAFMQLDEVATTYQRIKPYFNDVGFYSAAVPTYIGGVMTFAFASNQTGLRALSVAELQARAVDFKTRYYNSAIHHGAFALPQYILDELNHATNR